MPWIEIEAEKVGIFVVWKILVVFFFPNSRAAFGGSLREEQKFVEQDQIPPIFLYYQLLIDHMGLLSNNSYHSLPCWSLWWWVALRIETSYGHSCAVCCSVISSASLYWCPNYSTHLEFFFLFCFFILRISYVVSTTISLFSTSISLPKVWNTIAHLCIWPNHSRTNHFIIPCITIVMGVTPWDWILNDSNSSCFKRFLVDVLFFFFFIGMVLNWSSLSSLKFDEWIWWLLGFPKTVDVYLCSIRFRYLNIYAHAWCTE